MRYTILAALLVAPCFAVTNSITLTNNTGSPVTNYPLQFARPFVRGEIANYPQIGVCADSKCASVSTWLTTQADVKVHWDDSSVKHAILSVVIASVPAGPSYYTFRNQSGCNCGTGLTRAQMLDPAFNFDAQEQFTANSTTKTASARRILTDWDGAAVSPVMYWVAGTVATTVVLADFTPAYAYDLGWQPAGGMTLTAAITTSSNTIPVNDAHALVTPAMVRLWVPLSQSGFQNGSGEDVYVCSVTGNTLNLGAPGCATVPSVAGRAQNNTAARAAAIGDGVAPNNAWQDPSSSVYKSIKPIFVATFWPATHQVWVRLAAEVADTGRLQDQVYDLTLTTGNSSPATVLSQSQYTHRAGTQWTRSYWIGGTPPTVNITHNIAYLSSTRLMWNWDPTAAPAQSVIDGDYNAMLANGTRIGDLGPYTYFTMAATGGRPELGPEHRWFVEWVFTGNDEARQLCFNAADNVGSWVADIREGDATKKYDRGTLAISAFGKPAVPTQRKSISLTPGYDYYGTSSDAILPIGPFTLGPFQSFGDGEHIYNSTMPMYILTGDWYYLQVGVEWLSFTGLRQSASTTYGRGPTAAEGAVAAANIRAQAWMLRGRAQVALFAPDGTPEKALANLWTSDHLAAMEAILGFPNSYPANTTYTTMYNWGATFGSMQYYRIGGVRSPMGLIRFDPAFAQLNYGIDTSVVGAASSLYEFAYLSAVLAYVKNAGLYPSAANNLLSQMAVFYTGAVSNPNFNPYLLQAGRMPATYKNGSFINNWADMKAGYFPTQAQATANGTTIWQGLTSFPKSNAEGYDALSFSAMAAMADQPGGAAAWTWAAAQETGFTAMNNDPRWKLLPVTAAAATALSRISGQTKVTGVSVH
jgi:hypothetical protein